MILMIGVFSLRAAIAQKSVSASQILQDIKNGKEVSYENVTIEGTLDFTLMDEKIDDLTERTRRGKNSAHNNIDESTAVTVSFVNCTFTDDVLAYIHDDLSGYTFTADFKRDVTFRKCEFSGKAMFKYSNFEGEVDFGETKFRMESTFKYAEFDESASFANTGFNNDAIFKYADFDRGVTFENAVFEESLNIKYLDVRGAFNFDRVEVGGDIDSKYTSIKDRSFSSYLISSRN